MQHQNDTDSTFGRDMPLMSAAVSQLRLPLIMGVLLIHSNVPALQQAWTGSLPDAPQWALQAVGNVSLTLDRTVTSVFFFISGFLFFLGSEPFSAAVWRGKLRRRASTLLLPYLIWNAVFLIFHFAKSIFSPSAGIPVGSGRGIIGSAVCAFWNYTDGCPADLPLWYVRDLMVTVLFAPLIRILVRAKSAAAGVPLLAAWLWLFPQAGVAGVNPQAFFYFALGAFFSVNGISLTIRRRTVVVAAALVVVTITVFAQQAFGSACGEAFRLAAVAAIVTIGFGASPMRQNSRTGRAWRQISGITFFIYAAHALFASASVRLLCSAIPTSNAAGLLAVYVLSPLLTLAATLLLHAILHRLSPLSARVLNGGRQASAYKSERTLSQR